MNPYTLKIFYLFNQLLTFICEETFVSSQLLTLWI